MEIGSTELAVIIAWLVTAVYLAIKFRVSPGSLRNAPVRQSTVSLATFGGLVLLYWLLSVMAVALAETMHLLPPAPTATRPADATGTRDRSQPPERPARPERPGGDRVR